MPFISLSFSVSLVILTLSLFIAFSVSSSSEKMRKNICTSLSAVSQEKTSTHDITYIETDVSNFKEIVQKFTGIREEKLPPTIKNPTTVRPHPAGKSYSSAMGPRKQAFKIHERREGVRKLEIKLNNGGGGGGNGSSSSSSGAAARQRCIFGFGGELVMVSPVSPLELLARGSPRTPRTPSSTTTDEEMRGIFEKGYYFHPNGVTPRGVKPPPLLPLFPTDPSARDNQDSCSSSSC